MGPGGVDRVAGGPAIHQGKRGDGDGDKVTTGLINTKSRARGSEVLKGGEKYKEYDKIRVRK